MRKIFKLVSCVLLLAFLSCFISACGNPFQSCKHEHTSWVVESEPTYYTEGKKFLKCNDCGETIETQTLQSIYKTQTSVKSKLDRSLVKVMCYDYDKTTMLKQGSGFFIDTRGKFITNAHVVEDCYYIKIKNSYGVTHDVDKLYKYENTFSDYAILKTASTAYTSVAVEFKESADIGELVFAFGYPNNSSSPVITNGKITSNNNYDGLKLYYLNTAEIDHGSSGGILADSEGKVLGITTGEFDNSEYGAIKYEQFKSAVNAFYSTSKEPAEYFHTKKTITLGSYNADNYFDINVKVSSYGSTYVNYFVSLQLKSIYQNSKILMDSASISVTVKIETYYRYTAVYSVSSYSSSSTDYDYVTFYIYNNASLGTKQTKSSYSSLTCTSCTPKNVTYNYDYDVFSSYGTLLIYS